MGEKPLLRKDAKKNLCKYTKKMHSSGFPPTRTIVRILANNLAKSLGIKNKFNSEIHITAKDWL